MTTPLLSFDELIDSMEVLTISVDHSKSMEQMLDEGQYDVINYKVPDGSKVPIWGKIKEVIVGLLPANQPDLLPAIQQCYRLGIHAPSDHHLLVLGAQYPNLQRDGAIVSPSARRFSFGIPISLAILEDYRGRIIEYHCCRLHLLSWNPECTDRYLLVLKGQARTAALSKS